MRSMQKTMIVIVAAFALPLAARGELPTWEEFQGLLGKPISAPEVKQFVARFRLSQGQKFDEGSFSGFEKAPFSLLYRKNKIERIVIRISERPGNHWPIYTGSLLLGLQRQDTPKDAIRRLGQPAYRPDSRYLMFQYEKFELVLSFDEATERLAEIDLDAPRGKLKIKHPSAYDKLDNKAIGARMDRLVKKLNASLPSGWHAARGLAANVAPEPGADEVRITFETPIWKQSVVLPNGPAASPGDMPKRVKARFFFNLYLLPKYRQAEAEYVFEDCPFFFHDERRELVSLPEGFDRRCNEALKSAEKVLTRPPEPASDN
jgi:hypothetical protein